MANRYWVNTSADNLWSTSLNWASGVGETGGAGVPTSGDDVYFNGSGNSTCLFDINANINSLNVGSGYNSYINVNNKDVTVNNVWIGSGYFIMNTGSGTWNINGDWKYDYNAANINMRVSGDYANMYFNTDNQIIQTPYYPGSGYGRRTFGNVNFLKNILLRCGTSVDMGGGGATLVQCSSLIIASGATVRLDTELQINWGDVHIFGNVISSGTTIKDFSWYRLGNSNTTPKTFTKYPSSTTFLPSRVSITTSYYSQSILTATTFDCPILITTSNVVGSGADPFIFGSGIFTFNSDFDLTIVRNTDISFHNYLNNPSFYFYGSIDSITRGAASWYNGNGIIVFAGSNDQHIDLRIPLGSLEDIYIEKPIGTVDWTYGNQCKSLNIIGGDIIVRGVDISVTNDVNITKNFNYPLSLTSGTLNYGGNLTLVGNNLNYPIYINGTNFVNTTSDIPIAKYCNVTNSQRTGTGPNILAYAIENVDNSGNAGWDFRKLQRYVTLSSPFGKVIGTSYV